MPDKSSDVSPVDIIVIIKYSIVSIDTSYKKLNLRHSMNLSKFRQILSHANVRFFKPMLNRKIISIFNSYFNTEIFKEKEVTIILSLKKKKN